MFEDEAILIANQHDLHNICVLAIGGYGENDVDDPSKENDKKETKVDAEYRGSRDWQDAVGGATLTCMLCCSSCFLRACCCLAVVSQNYYFSFLSCIKVRS